MVGFSRLNVMGAAPSMGEEDAEDVVDGDDNGDEDDEDDGDKEDKENKEDPNVANVWFKATIWECSIWYFKPFRFL